MKRIIKDTLITILALVIIIILVLYARDGRLDLGVLKNDFIEAINLKGERIEERLNYNPIEAEDFVAKLKDKGLVVGDPELIGANGLGAKKAYKFNVEGYYMNFYIIDWDDEKNPDIVNTKNLVENEGKVYIEGKYYDAYVNKTALISKIDNNPKKDVIIAVFKNMEALDYDEMIRRREDNSLNPAVTTVDKVLDGFEFAIDDNPSEKYNKIQ